MDKKSACEIYPYSFEQFKQKLISSEFPSNPSFLINKFHIEYFKGYFENIKPKTFIIENEYIDHDFLEDYASYYVRCFKIYPKICKRFHFFKNSFTESDFLNLLGGIESGEINKNLYKEDYLGFIVVKPLPYTIIGRTCLKTYYDKSERNFPCIRSYNINLFGLDLTINSLAFQEQDNVVAACATSALWSAFQGTGHLFHHTIPSPAKITEYATKDNLSEMRAMPNYGLNAEQMVSSIKYIGLESHIVRIVDLFEFKSTIYAYLKAQIPVIFGFDLVILANTYNQIDLITGDLDGKHAVTITGFCIDSNESLRDENGLRCRAYKISKIYVHDDQVGPFAKMELDGEIIAINNYYNYTRFSISTYFPPMEDEKLKALPEILIIPLYHKIRIPFSIIKDSITHFVKILELISLKDRENKEIFQSIEWDIYLTQIEELKSDILNSSDIDDENKRSFLLESLPKFIWRGTGYFKEKRIVDFLFDATDIEQGTIFIRAIEYDKELSEAWHNGFNEIDLIDIKDVPLAQQIIIWYQHNNLPSA